MIALSELEWEGLEVIKDGLFEAMALCDARPGAATLTWLDDEKYIRQLAENPDITCVVCEVSLAEQIPESVTGVCVSSHPRNDFFLIHNHLCSSREYIRQEFDTVIGKNCNISPLSYIESKNVVIGDNVCIEEFVSIKANTKIGDNSRVRTGTVIGCDGYEFKNADNKIVYIEHAGGVIVGSDVDVYSNTCVCKAVFPWDDTVVGDSSKIDNLVHVAHACKIGKRNYIVAGTVLCGSLITEDDVYVGPNATIGKVIMSKGSRASLGSVVTTDVKPGTTLSGNFAIEHQKLIKHIKALMKEPF